MHKISKTRGLKGRHEVHKTINRYLFFQKKEGFAEHVEFLVKCFHRALHSTPDQNICDCLHMT